MARCTSSTSSAHQAGESPGEGVPLYYISPLHRRVGYHHKNQSQQFTSSSTSGHGVHHQLIRQENHRGRGWHSNIEYGHSSGVWLALEWIFIWGYSVKENKQQQTTNHLWGSWCEHVIWTWTNNRDGTVWVTLNIFWKRGKSWRVKSQTMNMMTSVITTNAKPLGFCCWYYYKFTIHR